MDDPTISQGALVETENESPGKEEERLTTCAWERTPPALAEKLRVAGAA
jgi:hypothetical protein